MSYHVQHRIVDEKTSVAEKRRTIPKSKKDLPSPGVEEMATRQSTKCARKRLRELLLGRGRSAGSTEEEEREIRQLAQKYPGIFADDIVCDNQGIEDDRRCPLNYLMARRSPSVSVETFEAVYDAYPDAIHSIDSFNDTVLSELASHADNSDKLFDLLKAVIDKSNAELAVIGASRFPIMQAMVNGCSQEVVQYMIDRHPGDPFRERASDQRTIFSTAVRWSRGSLEFLKYAFDQNPEAIRVKATDKFESTPLQSACDDHCKEEIILFLLGAYPEGVFVTGRDRKFPLHGLLGYPGTRTPVELLADKNLIATVALANPNAIFSTTYCKYAYPHWFSPFTSIMVRYTSGAGIEGIRA